MSLQNKPDLLEEVVPCERVPMNAVVASTQRHVSHRERLEHADSRVDTRVSEGPRSRLQESPVCFDLIRPFFSPLHMVRMIIWNGGNLVDFSLFVLDAVAELFRWFGFVSGNISVLTITQRQQVSITTIRFQKL